MTKREVGVDLFRVIATILVVLLHVLGQGGILQTTTPNETAHWLAWFLEICAYCAVNCFALISGYVMVDKTPKAKNIIGLWVQALFYSLLFAFVLFVLAPGPLTAKNLASSFFPVLGRQWWYVSAYFALFCFIPILNAGIRHIPQKAFKTLLLTILIGIGIVGRLLPEDAFMLNNGYSAIWLIIVYLFGAYIKKYGLKEKISALKSLLGFFAMVSLTFLSKFVIYFVTKSIYGEARYDNTFVSYTSATIVLASVFLFLFCLNVKMGSTPNKIVSFFSAASLGVYLIHVHPFVFDFVIKDAFVAFADMHPIVMLLCVLAAAASIFVLCSVVEWIRIWLFATVRINRLCERAGEKITSLLDGGTKNG